MAELRQQIELKEVAHEGMLSAKFLYGPAVHKPIESELFKHVGPM